MSHLEDAKALRAKIDIARISLMAEQEEELRGHVTALRLKRESVQAEHIEHTANASHYLELRNGIDAEIIELEKLLAEGV